MTTTSLADRLDVYLLLLYHACSKRLKSAGYVKHIPYQSVELTDRGQR